MNFWESPASGAAAVLLGVLITSMFDFWRDSRRKRQALLADQRHQLIVFLERVSFFDQRISSGMLVAAEHQVAYEATPSELSDLRIRAGLIMDPTCRSLLEDAIYSISELRPETDTRGSRFIYPLAGQQQILRSMINVGTACARGESPPEADRKLIERFANAGREGRIENEHFWTIEHGRG